MKNLIVLIAWLLPLLFYLIIRAIFGFEVAVLVALVDIASEIKKASMK